MDQAACQRWPRGWPNSTHRIRQHSRGTMTLGIIRSRHMEENGVVRVAVFRTSADTYKRNVRTFLAPLP